MTAREAELLLAYKHRDRLKPPDPQWQQAFALVEQHLEHEAQVRANEAAVIARNRRLDLVAMYPNPTDRLMREHSAVQM